MDLALICMPLTGMRFSRAVEKSPCSRPQPARQRCFLPDRPWQGMGNFQADLVEAQLPLLHRNKAVPSQDDVIQHGDREHLPRLH
jgi:hypothetical protein